MVTHNNESALTIVVPLSPRSPLDVRTSLHDMRIFERLVETKEETKLFIIAKKSKQTNKQSLQFQKNTNVRLLVSRQFKR